MKLALIPGGAHPYFQPWKTTAELDKTDFKLGDVTFNETGEWDQGKQNNVINSLAAQGYNAFGIFGVSPTDINSTFEDLKAKGFAVGSLASCPAGDTNSADFCLSTDVEAAAYKAAKATIEAIGGDRHDRAPDRQQRRLEHPAPDRRREEGGRRDRRQGHRTAGDHRHRQGPADRAEGGRRPARLEGQGDQGHRHHRLQPGRGRGRRCCQQQASDQGGRDRRRRQDPVRDQVRRRRRDGHPEPGRSGVRRWLAARPARLASSAR